MSAEPARRGRGRKSIGEGRAQSQAKITKSLTSSSTGRANNAEKDLSSVEAFEKPFVAKEFIEGLSRRLVYQQADKKSDANSSDPITELFDPKPFQDTFDSALTKLLKLRAEVDAKINGVAKQCLSLEKEQQRRIQALRVQFDNIFKDFKQLDMTTNKISANAVRIGGILEGMDAQRDRAISVHQYFEHIIRLNEHDDLNPQDVFGDMAEYDLAVLLKNLLLISAELDMSQTQVAKQNIERMSADLERVQLARFVQAAGERKYGVMTETARTLFEFNGGDSCVREYINQLGVFLNIEELKNYKIYEPPPPPPPVQKGQKQPVPEPPPDAATQVATMLSALETNMVAIDQFLADILHSLNSEWEVIEKVFPGPALVFSKLAESVFSIRVDKFVEIILENANGDLNLYLGTFSHLVEKTAAMCQTLAGPPIRMPHSRVQSFADSVFRPHTDTYIDNEIQSMLKFYVLEADPTSAGAHKDSSFFQWSKGKDAALIMTPELTISCFDRFRDAMRRCTILSHSTRVPKNMSTIFQTFIKEFGEGMTAKSLDSVINNLSKVSEVRDVQDFFELIQSVNTNAVLIENHFSDIKPHLESNREEYDACVKAKAKLLHLLEEKIAAGLDKVLTAQIAHIKRLLKRNQSSSDFYPSKGNMSFQATQACVQVCKYVKDQHNLVSRCLDGGNVEIFLHEFGFRMLQLILKHIKKWTIETQFGVLVLISDLTAYQEAISSFGIERLNMEYDVLKSIGKLYMVAPEQFKELIADTQLRTMDPKEVEDLIRRRSDFTSSWIGKFLPSL